MGGWVTGGAEIVGSAPRVWVAFALPALAVAAIPFPSWLMDALSPLGLLIGLYLAGHCDGQTYSKKQIWHALEVAVLWGMLLAIFGMVSSFGRDTVIIGAILSGIHGGWHAQAIMSGFWGWWFGFCDRLSDLAMMPYFWFSPAFFGIALALHKGHGWIEAEIETSLALIFRQELRDPVIGLWGILLVSSVLLPRFSQVWLGLVVWILGPPIIHVAYEDIFANRQRPRRRREKARISVLQARHRKVSA